METFKINGVEYTSRPQAPKKPMSKYLGIVLVMQGMVGSSRSNNTPTVDIVKEV